MNHKIVIQNGVCPICSEEFTEYADVVPDPRQKSESMGGAFRDDHPSNIQVTHYWCNGEKGSTRMDE